MKRFSVVNNGYDVEEVNRFIDIVIGRLEKLNAENASYLAKIDKLNKQLEDTKTIDTSKLEKAILAVQDTSDKMKEVAKEEARMIVEEAKNNANSIIHEALVNAEKVENERMMLEKNIKVYKERIKSLLKSELEIVDDLDKVEL
jgi:cell division initiation protein